LGYTSYINNQPIAHDENKWDMFVEAVKHVASELPQTTDTAGGYHKDDPLVLGAWEGEGGEPVFNENEIFFNGVGDLSHESFFIGRFPDPDRREFDFCKTARKPYDLMVCATLSLYWHFFKDDGVKVSSDGDTSDWEPARELVKKVTGLDICPLTGVDRLAEEAEDVVISLLDDGITVTLTGDGGGSVTDDLHIEGDDLYNSAIDGITSMILAHAIAGVDIESPEYVEGIDTAIAGIAENT
jgi:hypothetical protein